MAPARSALMVLAMFIMIVAVFSWTASAQLAPQPAPDMATGAGYSTRILPAAALWSFLLLSTLALLDLKY
ncbi:hypothetical protein CDL15_Pgr028836 [Punica granatum]|uniref:Uncharacterized protein n=1 Tax=Punica granatum TaxID=22663 RepID=A0A218WXG1_PUNGR|nr:hypothetical protein CDL15_Pgr028836 [Punica granatum]PKI47409.1 hypothetical protein CRG98_032244 [Punica granatum]